MIWYYSQNARIYVFYCSNVQRRSVKLCATIVHHLINKSIFLGDQFQFMTNSWKYFVTNEYVAFEFYLNLSEQYVLELNLSLWRTVCFWSKVGMDFVLAFLYSSFFKQRINSRSFFSRLMRKGPVLRSTFLGNLLNKDENLFPKNIEKFFRKKMWRSGNSMILELRASLILV